MGIYLNWIPSARAIWNSDDYDLTGFEVSVSSLELLWSPFTIHPKVPGHLCWLWVTAVSSLLRVCGFLGSVCFGYNSDSPLRLPLNQDSQFIMDVVEFAWDLCNTFQLVQDLFVSSKELVCGKTDRFDFYTYVWLLSCIMIRTPIHKFDLEKSHQRHEVMQHLLTLMDRHTNPYLLHQ